MNAPATVDILLATCNGQAYLPALLDSLAAQTYPHWRLLTRDDGSTDQTVTILDAFARRHPQRVRILRDDRPRLGARGNFAALMDHADAPYVAFCDQDDVWLPEKIEITLAAMVDLQRRHGPAHPVLVHTDLTVVAEDLTQLAPSLWRYQHVDQARAGRFGRLLVQNTVTGCSVMINAALRDLARPIPDDAIMHDWWLALTAAAFGTIEPVPRATALYRQHSGNDTGAKRWNARYVVGKARSFWSKGGLGDRLRQSQRQAAAFADRFADALDEHDRHAAQAYGGIAGHGFLARRRLLLKHGLLMHGRPGMSLIKNIGLFLRI